MAGTMETAAFSQKAPHRVVVDDRWPGTIRSSKHMTRRAGSRPSRFENKGSVRVRGGARCDLRESAPVLRVTS
jgi:hypothetical protein